MEGILSERRMDADGKSQLVPAVFQVACRPVYSSPGHCQFCRNEYINAVSKVTFYAGC
jgi:hypothetical protein